MKSNRLAVLLFVATFLRTDSIRAADTPSTNQPVTLPTVTVIGINEQPALTSPPITATTNIQRAVPGGVTIVDAARLQRNRGTSFIDLLQGVPGVVVQSQNGMEATKLSIRGSGVVGEDEPIGIQVLLDGFTFNQGDGEIILEDFDLNSIQYAEVYRGANAFKYGAITLGGAINLVSKSGYDAAPFSAGAAGGSFGFVAGQASTGGVEGPMDYYASIWGRQRDGFREHSYENTEGLFSNFGYRVTTNTENRLYLTVSRTDRLIPGDLTKQQMESDPQQAVPQNVEEDANKEWYYLRLADKLSYKNDVEEADAGGYWWHRNLLTRDLYDANDFNGIQGYYSDNFGFLLNSVTRFQLFGLPNNLTVGANPTYENENDGNFQNNDGQEGAQISKDSEVSINAPLYAEDQQYVTENISLVAGLQAIYAQRHFRDFFNNTASGNQAADLVFRTINPKIGAIWNIDSKSQVYANFSRSWQPPSFDNMVDFDDNNPPPPFGTGSLVFTPLEPQRAWTVEVGTRGQEGRFGWELSLYHSWVRNELLEINNAQGIDIGAVNVNRTMHQGIEAGLETELLGLIFTKGTNEELEDKLTLEQTYTLTDLHFVNDPVYGDNRIAGIPVHYYEADLLYESPCGFYAGPNVEWNLTRYPVDHANTLYADPYALMGFKAGYQSKHGYTIFFQAMNLTDQHYPGAVDPIPDARTAGGPAQVFQPGDGRAFYGGVSWAIW